jgi:hypothetical protein
MKRPGDGWVIIDWYICPFCGKKGYYQKYSGGWGHAWYCKYCKSFGNKPKEPECEHDGIIHPGHHADQPCWCDKCGKDI